MTARDKRVEKAQIRVLFKVPFFAAGVAKLPVSFDATLDPPTACTNGERIRFHPDFFDKLDDGQIGTVLCHEVAHCMLGHLWRIPGWDSEEDQQVRLKRWNIACDHAVNLMLKKFSEVTTAARHADPFPFPEPKESYHADPAFADLAEEEILRRLPKPPKGDNPDGNGQGGQQQGQGQSNQRGKPGKGQVQPAPGSMPSFGDFEQPGPKPGQGQAPSPSSSKRLQQDWERTLIDAVTIAQGRGELPAGMERLVDAVVNPKVPWWELLRAFLREQVADDWNWMKPDALYDETGFILPTLESERMGPVVFARDTSGSTQGVQDQFLGEAQQCLDDLRPASLLDICCDADIQRVKEYSPGETLDREVPGGGGTDFRPVFEHIEGLAVKPKCLVYLTDLEGSFPDAEPDYPVLWVVLGNGGKTPWGEVVRV